MLDGVHQLADARSPFGRGGGLARQRQTINRVETQVLVAMIEDLHPLGVGTTCVTDSSYVVRGLERIIRAVLQRVNIHLWQKVGEVLRRASHLSSKILGKAQSHLDLGVAETRGAPPNWYAANMIADELVGHWAARVQVASSTVGSLEMAGAIGSTVRTRFTMAPLRATQAEPRRKKPTRRDLPRFKERMALSGHE